MLLSPPLTDRPVQQEMLGIKVGRVQTNTDVFRAAGGETGPVSDSSLVFSAELSGNFQVLQQMNFTKSSFSIEKVI